LGDVYNSDFNRIEFDAVKNKSGSNSFSISPEKWIKYTNAIGIRSSSGRYGGTFAHKDIAFEFATWISPEFKLFLIKEFQRLKQEEHEKLSLDWSAKRMLTKINYKVHTDSIKEHILIPQEISGNFARLMYASEADVLNMALFGVTAKDWRILNPDAEGNIRDYADVYQLVCLSNLESLNAEFIRMGMAQSERLLQLNRSAITQMKSLQGNDLISKLEGKKNKKTIE
jgi:KilA-N domain